MSSFYVENFGCRATQADGAAIEHQFEERGFQRASAASQADFVVLNTCTVTAAADQDARAAIRRVHRINPECQIIVTGCYAQRAPAEIATLPGVTMVVGNSHKHQLADFVHTKPGHSFVPLASLARRDREAIPIHVSDIFAHTELLAAPVFDASNERTRPNLKVQDGCDNRCSFCVIPSVRGHSRSLPLPQALREVNSLVDTGYKEVVISGINLGRWGRDLESQQSGTICSRRLRLEGLVRAILDQTELQKLRISSVEPMDWSDELIQLMASTPRIAKHTHVPLQSGSDTVLRRMHRKYRPWHYREKIEKIHALMPAAAIGADVMVGFPGESEAEFEETQRMVQDLPFTYLHVFTYSPRPGTSAAAMGNQVPVRIARERNRVLRELASQKKLGFMQSFVGRSIQAITLNKSPEQGNSPFTEALTDNYLKLYLTGSHLANTWLTASVHGLEEEVLLGSKV
ncbi:MAG: tRNA (N(6)-L-threonylcarbamoyladenosine(37)-C(2))-methylthiotransferase MtaB [Acidobacteria bacterium]|nr:MAG: tRNA (N(6)-L-threonylcarbamoyladenosine(37)-C(2))-methylthiotransferase MtaB [Acidobacteriota bacterium]